MATKVAGELYKSITGQLFEIGRQLRQPNGYPFNPEELQRHLQAAIEGKFIYKIWKTIKLGTNGLKTVDDFCREAIKGCGMKIGDYANDILGKPQFTAAIKEIEVDLVLVSVAELGFKGGAKLKDIYARAKELGLELCLNEVGPQLRLQYVDQPKDELLVIGMEPITDSDDNLKLFYVVQNNGSLWLDSDYGYPGGSWGAGVRFVFVLPRK